MDGSLIQKSKTMRLNSNRPDISNKSSISLYVGRGLRMNVNGEMICKLRRNVRELTTFVTMLQFNITQIAVTVQKSVNLCVSVVVNMYEKKWYFAFTITFNSNLYINCSSYTLAHYKTNIHHLKGINRLHTSTLMPFAMNECRSMKCGFANRVRHVPKMGNLAAQCCLAIVVV